MAIELSSTVMKVAMEMTATIDQGLRLPATERAGVQSLAVRSDVESDTSAHRDGRLDGHAWTEETVLWRLIEHDLHRNALDDLDIVPGRVLGG